MVTDGKGLPLAVTLTAGQTHESTQLHNLMHEVNRPVRIGWPDKLAGDKGYSYETIREFLADCRIEAVIPRPAATRHAPKAKHSTRRRTENALE